VITPLGIYRLLDQRHASKRHSFYSSLQTRHTGACSAPKYKPYSPGYGKESDVRLSVAYTERVNREWVQRTYAGFLTDEEFVAILDNGKDLYFFADDLRERLPKYAEYRAAREAEYMAEMQQYISSLNEAA